MDRCLTYLRTLKTFFTSDWVFCVHTSRTLEFRPLRGCHHLTVRCIFILEPHRYTTILGHLSLMINEFVYLLMSYFPAICALLWSTLQSDCSLLFRSVDFWHILDKGLRWKWDLLNIGLPRSNFPFHALKCLLVVANFWFDFTSTFLLLWFKWSLFKFCTFVYVMCVGTHVQVHMHRCLHVEALGWC